MIKPLHINSHLFNHATTHFTYKSFKNINEFYTLFFISSVRSSISLSRGQNICAERGKNKILKNLETPRMLKNIVKINKHTHLFYSRVLRKHLCVWKWRQKHFSSWSPLYLGKSNQSCTQSWSGIKVGGHFAWRTTKRTKDSELEEVDKVLRGDRHEAVWIVGCARVATVLEHSWQPNFRNKVTERPCLCTHTHGHCNQLVNSNLFYYILQCKWTRGD